MDNHAVPPVSEEQLATATDGYYRREGQFASPVGSQRPHMLGRCSFRRGSGLFFFKSIWSGEGKEVGDRVEGEGDRLDLIKLHYKHIGNSQTIKREHRLNKRLFFF